MGRLKMILAAGTAVAAVAAAGASPALGATASDDTQFSVTAGALSFTSAPNVPTLSGVTLSGGAQSTNSSMSSWTAQDATGSGSGWNTTVQGDSGVGKSAVFKEYCTNGLSCGSLDYVTGGQTLSANSLTLSSTSGSFSAQSGTTGTAPTHNCSTACNVDSASAVKVASAAANAGMGTYQASYASNALTLSTPSTLKALGTDREYRVDLTWTLSSGP